MNPSVGKKWRCRCREQTCGEMPLNCALFFSTIWKIDSQWEFDMWSRAPKASVTTWRDGVGREVGRGFKKKGTHVCLWQIYTVVWQKPSQYCKVLSSNENKWIFLKKKEKMRYFFDVSEDDVQLCKITGHHLQPINSRRAQRNIPEYWGRRETLGEIEYGGEDVFL